MSILRKKTSSAFSQRLLNERLDEGVTEILRERDNRAYLIAYSKLSLASISVVSMLDKEDAFEAVQKLILQSLYVLSFLFFSTFIVSIFASRGVTNTINELLQGTLKMASGDLSVKLNVKSQDEVGVLAQNFNVMAGEVSRLMMEEKEKSRMASELKTAQTVQNTLFPKSDFKNEQYNISGYYSPASECGGDWWYYYTDNDKVYLLIGDATGHGAPAALITKCCTISYFYFGKHENATK